MGRGPATRTLFLLAILTGGALFLRPCGETNGLSVTVVTAAFSTNQTGWVHWNLTFGVDVGTLRYTRSPLRGCTLLGHGRLSSCLCRRSCLRWSCLSRAAMRHCCNRLHRLATYCLCVLAMG